MTSPGLPGFPAYESPEEFAPLLAAAQVRLLHQVGSRRQSLLDAAVRQAITDTGLLFDTSADLRQLEAVRGQSAVDALRHLPRWPISSDVMKNLVVALDSGPELGETRDGHLGRLRATVVRHLWSPEDYPWLAGSRGPTPAEREHSILTVAGRLARQRAETAWRTDSCKDTEQLVRDLAQRAGYRPVALPRLSSPSDLPPGCFTTGQTRVVVDGEPIMADHAIRFGPAGHHGLLLVEAKFAADVTNSHKRLRHECQKKAAAWKTIPGAEIHVLAFFDGVTAWDKVAGLQNMGIHFLYGHDALRLNAYVRWLAARL